MTLEITDANIKQFLADPQPLVIDFWAPWCGPCKMMLPIVDQLAAENEGRIRIGKLNVDENPDSCEQFGIMSIPTMLIFKNGEVVNRHVGAAPKTEIQKLLDAIL